MAASFPKLSDKQMQTFPLDPFLASLEADGIRLTVRDFERINRLLEREGDWTLTQFRDSLAALLVKDEDQQQHFIRRFEEFLQAPAGAESNYADVDLDAALNDLEQLSKTPVEPASKPSTTVSPRIKAPAIKSVWKRIPWWKIFTGLLIIGMIASIGFLFMRPPAYRLHVDREEIQFGAHPTGGQVSEILSVTNTGRKPLEMSVALDGEHTDFFEWECDLEPPLLPGETRPVQVKYLPTAIAEHNAEIVFGARGQFIEKRVPISGAGQSPQLEPESLEPEPEIVAPPPQQDPGRRNIIGLGGIYICVSLLYVLNQYRASRVPKDKPAQWDENGPRHFPLGSIGGKPSTWLDEETLDYLADGG